MGTFTWRGASGSWFDSANWTSDQVPTTSDTAVIGSGTPQVSSGGEIVGETILLGGSASGGSVTLEVTDATLAPLISGTNNSGIPKVKENMFLMVTGGGSSSPVSATVLARGTTTFEGELIVEPINGALTISAAPAGGEAGHFEFLNTTDESFGLVTQESVLNLTGGEITNSAVIEVEGTLNLASGTTLDGGGIVAMDDGGHLNLSGTVSSDQAIDFVDSTGSVAIASGATVSAEFGFTGIAGGRIDLAGVAATSEVVSGGVLTLLSGGTAVAELNVRSVNAASLNPDSSGPQPVTSDFTLASDGHGGTLVTYTPPGPTVLQASMPVPVVAPTGSLVSLTSILGQSFGPAAPGFYQIKLLLPTIATNSATDQKYWSTEVPPAWYVNGVRIASDYVVQPGDNVQLQVGDNIEDPAQIQVQVTPTVTSNSGEYIDYSIWTVDPSVAAQVTSSGGIAGHPTSSSVIAAAYALSGAFPDVPNTNLCNSIADDVAAAAGAPMPLPNASLDPSLNMEGGFWRIVYLHRVETATRCLKLARQYFDAQIVYSVADLHHLRLKAQSRLDHEHGIELLQEAQTVALQELTAALAADCVITHSISEAAQLEQLYAIAHANKVRVVPWTAPVAPVRAPFAHRTGVAFIGGFAHSPNRDAARWLADEIMPLVWREAPEVQCLIAGSDLPTELSRELARPGIVVLGQVQRLSDVFERVRLTVAPLRFGAGLKDKVLRSMAAGLPCIGTAEAFNGMPELPAGIVSRCQRESASDLAAAIVAMHRHKGINARCADQGLSYVAECYNQARIDALMRDLVEPALARYGARAAPACKVLRFGYDDKPARRVAAT